MIAGEHAPGASWTRTAGWGLYCACSWTWCIGMFLPILLLERFGWPGFLAFAVPNVLGCAAFGYVLDARRAATVRARSPRLTRAFSRVTIAFHVFFAGMIAVRLVPDPMTARMTGVAAAALLLGAGAVVSRLPTHWWPALALAVYVLSLAAFVAVGAAPLERLGWSGNEPTWWLWFIAPAMAFGFLLCPYLDLTFMRARMETSGPHAFAVFGVTFTVMLLLTCAYAVLPSGVAFGLLLTHLTAQSIFTVAAHDREVRLAGGGADRGRALRWVGVLVALLVGLLPAAEGESMYIRWLVFYGLLFPAAVLLLVRPWRPVAGPLLSLGGFGLLMLVLAPCYEAGFLHGSPWLLVIPLLLLPGLALARRDRPLPVSPITPVVPTAAPVGGPRAIDPESA